MNFRRAFGAILASAVISGAELAPHAALANVLDGTSRPSTTAAASATAHAVPATLVSKTTAVAANNSPDYAWRINTMRMMPGAYAQQDLEMVQNMLMYHNHMAGRWYTAKTTYYFKYTLVPWVEAVDVFAPSHCRFPSGREYYTIMSNERPKSHAAVFSLSCYEVAPSTKIVTRVDIGFTKYFVTTAPSIR